MSPDARIQAIFIRTYLPLPLRGDIGFHIADRVAKYKSVPSANNAFVICGMRSAAWNRFHSEQYLRDNMVGHVLSALLDGARSGRMVKL